jgi:antitoxin component YwqK of YwqJK toxin-antitoxin module
LASEKETPSATEEKDFHPDGSVRIIRHVRRDSAGGKQLHGAWQWWDMAGRLVADGEFVNGLREGRWRRMHTVEDTPTLRDPHYAGFDPPFLSEAGFRDGKLHGVWKITDARGRLASAVRYSVGERDGLAEWWFASGRKSQQAEYRMGRLSGELVRWNVGGEELFRRGFDDAREIVMQTAAYPGGQRRMSVTLLTAPLLLEGRDDWWSAQRSEHRPQGHDERHGITALWHANGQIARHGAFEHDLPIGTHTWWFAQGQKAASGDFVDGHAEGEWIWWRPSGQERARGVFACGLPVGEWKWTRVDGSTIAASGEQVVAATMARGSDVPRDATVPRASVVTAPNTSPRKNAPQIGPLGSGGSDRPLPSDPHAALHALFGTQWPRRDALPLPPAMATTARQDRVELRR